MLSTDEFVRLQDPCPAATTLCSAACYTPLQTIPIWNESVTYCGGAEEQLPTPSTLQEIRCLMELAACYSGPHPVEEILTGYSNTATGFQTPDGSAVAPPELVGSEEPDGHSDSCVAVITAGQKLGTGCGGDVVTHFTCQLHTIA